jgi:Glycosyl transferase family 2.
MSYQLTVTILFNGIFDFEKLSSIIYDLAKEGIFSAYTSIGYHEHIRVSDKLIVVSDITKVSSFLLMSPIYDLTLNLIDKSAEIDEIDWLAFVKLLVPNSMLISEEKNFISKQAKIHIISPFRNVEKYIDDYIDSILKQSYSNYQITLIDDCSNDNSVAHIPNSPRIKIRSNSVRKFALINILDVLLEGSFDDDDIICLVDADDILPHKYVLNIVNNAYQIGQTTITYGAMSNFGSFLKHGTPYTKEEFDNLRQSLWRALHLRTFKYKVFKALLNIDRNLNCLRDNTGNIFRMPYDQALFFPLLELSGFENVQFIDSITYKYRRHPNNDSFENLQEQLEGERQIRNKQPFRSIF